ncbi:MAG: hypothetical protein ACTHYM_13960 [Actinomycetaceae bacterium]
MRHLRLTGAGATLALAAALASCTPVESLDDEESTSATESASASDPAPEETTGTEEEPTEAGTEGEPTDDAEEETTAVSPFEPTEEPSATEDPTAGEDGDAEGDAPAEDGRVTVEHDAGTVSYALPEGWNDLSFAYEGHPTIVMGAAPLETAANGSQVTLTAIEGGAGSFDAYREAIDAQRPEGAELVEADPLTVDGATVQGLRVEMETPQGGFVQYTFPIFEGGYQWELQFAMDAGDEEADYATMRQVAESIVIE